MTRGASRLAAFALVLAAGACSSTTITNVFVTNDGGDGDASAPETGGSDPGDEEPAEYDGSCGTAASPISEWCQIESRCTSLQCAGSGEAYLYQCFTLDGGNRPPIRGCRDMGPFQNIQEWCCPPACVRHQASCGGDRAFYCPIAMDGTLAAPLPSAKCRRIGGDSVVGAYCCP